MKRKLYFLLAVVCCNLYMASATSLIENAGNNPGQSGTPSAVSPQFQTVADNEMQSNPVSPLVINQYDSVFFDIGQAVINGSFIEFPVYLRSDDVINALDFAFKYNQSHLQYDTIINLTNYIEPLSYYNPNDSTVRLTSYSFTQPYSNDTPLVIVRFTLLSGQLCSSDLDSVSALLNGDASSFFVSDCVSGLFDGTSEIHVSLFPNPAKDMVTVEVPGMTSLEIFDTNLKSVMVRTQASPLNIFSIDTSELNNGIYFIRVAGDDFTGFQKLVINR